jgi:predicted Zn-dependent peptidase
MVEESHEELIHDLYFELVFGKHGLGRPILGTETSIRRTQRRGLLTFFRKHYHPEQTIISVAGNVSHETVRRRLRALAKAKWPGRLPKKPTKRDIGFEPAPKMREGSWWIKRNTEQVHIVWGVEGISYRSRDRFAVYLLNEYLGGGMSSKLFQEIREKHGLAYTVYSSHSSFEDSGVFSVYAATSMSHVPLCLRLIEEAVDGLRREPLTEQDLQILKDNLKGTILLNSDDVESRMSSIAQNEIFHGQAIPLAEVCRLIDAVSVADIRRLARKLFAGGKRSMLFIGPSPSKQIRTKLRPKILKK